jgi:Fe-S cluster biogenesis protein NfuA
MLAPFGGIIVAGSRRNKGAIAAPARCRLVGGHALTRLAGRLRYEGYGRPAARRRKRISMEDRIKQVLETIRPALQKDGGDVEFIDFHEGTVTVRLKGACGNCPMSTMTLKQGIEKRLRAAIPEVVAVESL